MEPPQYQNRLLLSTFFLTFYQLSDTIPTSRMSSIPNNPLRLSSNETSNQATQIETYLTNTPTSVVEAWSGYSEHLKKWFYNPDLEAVRITLAAAASNFHKDCDPVWLFILGPSGGDKSSININSIHDFPQVHQQGDITAKTFLSGYTGTANASLLHRIGASGILSFKDFTTFCSKTADEKAAIAGQLREIADGEFHKETGKGIPINWKGKITIIAAATPQFEEEWAVHRKMGERFIQVRLNRKDGVKQAEYAQRQRGWEEHIISTMRRLALEFFQSQPAITIPRPTLTDQQITRIASMAEIVCHCRGEVPRNKINRAISGRAFIENNSRIPKSLASLVSNHAALFRRTEVIESDMTVAKRIALNTIPDTRSIILSCIPIDSSIDSARLQIATTFPESTLAEHIADLEALGVVRVQHNQVLANEISLTPRIQELWKIAFVQPAQPAQPQPGLPLESQQGLGVVH